VAYNEFITSLRTASRLMVPPRVRTVPGSRHESSIAAALESADFWLTKRSVKGFDPADFAPLDPAERRALEAEVNAFLEVAATVPAKGPASLEQSEQGRLHLERILEIVRKPILDEWIKAQEWMMNEAAEAARSRKWLVERDTHVVSESLLGIYECPRLLVRSWNAEAMLATVARFGVLGEGIVHVVVSPAYEREAYITYKNSRWRISLARGDQATKAFSQASFIKTIGPLIDR
jgi:hypothetical protein